ncbi:MAG: recombinase family protein [Humidesulfovibrio sp.]|uniref:recombinase family protein n=1 Tax=Humidesulfovibrio sp. TaxID=2910988 RepID=UPI0027F96720|nr:recombinase family protein [Humidesulfovibrio sp.]MDQ7835596.1 recombinase family protein [Humidesulfovibrio sp.]
MGKVYAYLRVSTDRQDLENQRMEITAYAARLGLEVSEWLEVEISSRKDISKRRIVELVDRLKRGDVLVVSEVSRLARSMREVHNIMGDLAAKKVEVHIIKQNVVARGEGDMTTDILINAFAMAAQMERTLISQRTKNGLARVKAQGKKLGNPNLERINTARQEKADQGVERLRGTLAAFKGQGMTQRRMVEELNTLGIRTAQGCTWSLCAVQRALKRLGL